MSLRKALLAATVLALPVAAQAQINAPVTGLYIAGGGGLNFHQDSDINRVTVPGVGVFRGGNDRIRYDDVGGVGLGSIGWGFGNGLRVEVEGNYRENNVDEFRASGLRNTSSGGYLRNYGVMGNVLYDFTALLPGFVAVPYVGVGAGYGWTEGKKLRGDFVGLPGSGLVGTTTRLESNDTDGNFAYQGIAGLAFGLDSLVPGLAFTAEYRFYGTLDPELDATVRTVGVGVPGGVAVSRQRIEFDNYNHSVLLGVRYAINAPRRAPAVVAPTPAQPGVARTYLVFFDWDRADLTDRARQIIAEAAGAARRTQTTRVEVAGHADRSGTPQYNQRLSQRRADVVAAELVRNGVNRNEIVVTAFGESRPLVPTADGVREPQNRRVEIVLR